MSDAAAASGETTAKYQDTFITMSYWFITMCFAEFALFAFMSGRAAYKYLPIFTSVTIGILMAFLMSYLVQAALFLRIRKHLGDKDLSEESNQMYDLYLRIVSMAHQSIYLLFFLIIFRIESVYLQFQGAPWSKVRSTETKLKLFAASYVILMTTFHAAAILISSNNKYKYHYIYVLGSLAFIMYNACFIRFLFKLDDFVKREFDMTNHRILFVIWYIMFLTEVVFLTYLRPAGELSFLKMSVFELAKHHGGYLDIIRRYLQVNENVQLFIMGMFIIQVYNYFGERYYRSLI